MIIIPVIDLLDGLVVLAKKGARDLYRPVNSRLCSDPLPLAVINTFISLSPFHTIYIADLNAIMHKDDNLELIVKLVNTFPQLEFWVDAGNRSMELNGLDQVIPVISTETGTSPDDLANYHSENRYILSLDYMNGDLIGDPRLLALTELWPDKIIIMSMDLVGSRSGPDTNLVSNIQLQIPKKKLYIAGGVRNSGDLATLADMNVSGALIASALHNQDLNRQDINLYL